MIGIVCDKNDPAQRLRFELWVGEKQNGTARFAQKATGDVSEKWMECTLFLQRAGDDKIDIVVDDRPQDSVGRIALAIIDR